MSHRKRRWIYCDAKFFTVDGNCSNAKVFRVNTNRVALVKVGKLNFSIPMRFLLLILLTYGFSLQAQRVPVTEKTLSNGMRVLLVQRNDEPTVSGGWVAHVGSSNERPGITGIASITPSGA